MLSRPGRVGALLAGLAAASLGASLTLAPAAGAAEEPDGGRPVADATCADAAQDSDSNVRSPRPSLPLEQMQVAQAQERGATGEGIAVAVIDSGVAEGTDYFGDLRVEGPQVARGLPPVEHGTIVAGLIAGDRPGGGPGEPKEGAGMGVAPGATVYSLRILGDIEDDETSILEEDDFEEQPVLDALGWVADEAGPRGIRIVNMSLTMPGSPRLERAVRRVQDAGVIVVAATGNRAPDDEPPEDELQPRPPDAERFPAAYPGVVGVGTYVNRSAGRSQDFVLSSPVVDVAAPSLGGISVVPSGSSCFLDQLATSWSTAYVSGALALLADFYEGETNEQVLARLVETASGVRGTRNPFTGAGMIQPLQAMQRELSPAPDGSLPTTEQVGESGAAPEPPVRADELEDARDDFRWWGLLAGAVLVAAVILRPLMRRISRR